MGKKELSALANVAVQKVEDKKAKPLPLFQEIEKQFEEVRRRAFGLFEKRGCELGHALEDWLEAKCVWTEFQSNDVYRRFELPEAIDMDKTKKQNMEAKQVAVRAA